MNPGLPPSELVVDGNHAFPFLSTSRKTLPLLTGILTPNDDSIDTCLMDP